MKVKPTKTGLFVSIVLVTLAILVSRTAKATEFIKSSRNTDVLAGSEQLGSSTPSNRFVYGCTNDAFSTVSVGIGGVEAIGGYQRHLFLLTMRIRDIEPHEFLIEGHHGESL